MRLIIALTLILLATNVTFAKNRVIVNSKPINIVHADRIVKSDRVIIDLYISEKAKVSTNRVLVKNQVLTFYIPIALVKEGEYDVEVISEEDFRNFHINFLDEENIEIADDKVTLAYSKVKVASNKTKTRGTGSLATGEIEGKIKFSDVFFPGDHLSSIAFEFDLTMKSKKSKFSIKAKDLDNACEKFDFKIGNKEKKLRLRAENLYPYVSRSSKINSHVPPIFRKLK